MAQNLQCNVGWSFRDDDGQRGLLKMYDRPKERPSEAYKPSTDFYVAAMTWLQTALPQYDHGRVRDAVQEIGEVYCVGGGGGAQWSITSGHIVLTKI